jgi:hypothetical protein
MNYDDMTITQRNIVYHQAQMNISMFWYLVPESRLSSKSEEYVKQEAFADIIVNRTITARLECEHDGIFSVENRDDIRQAIRENYDMMDDIMSHIKKEWTEETVIDTYTERWKKLKTNIFRGTASPSDEILYSYLVNIFVNALYDLTKGE